MPGDIRPMDPAYAIEPGFAEAIDGEVLLAPAIANTWKADLDGVSLSVDLNEAPDVAFAGEQRIEPSSQQATIEVQRTAVPDPQRLGDNFVMAPQSVEVEQTVPSGASAVRVALRATEPDSSAQLKLEAFAAGGRQPFAVDEAPAGGTASFTLSSPAEIGAQGGPWTLRASTLFYRSSDNRVDPQVLDVPVTFDVTAWYNASGERSLVQTTDATLVFGDIETFPVAMVFGEAGGQVIRYTARAHVHYDHDNSANPDDEWMAITLEVPIEDGADGLALGAQAGPIIHVPDNAIHLDKVSEAVGYGAAFLLVSSTVSGGMFGKASRRSLNTVFGGARRRVAFHNFLSYGIITAASAHLALFLIENQYHWSKGLIWGGAGITMLLALGVTGAMQVPIIRRWNYNTWRWVHFGLAAGAVLFTLAHMMLDGANFGAVQEALDYQDPLAPSLG